MPNRRFQVAFLIAMAATPVLAHGAPRGEAKATFGGKVVSVDYGRPSLAGRDMLERADVGKPWRMGADQPTTLTTETDLSFGSARVPKGTYVLTATKTAEGAWTLNIAKQDKTAVADVPLAASKLQETVEMFTIELEAKKDEGSLALKWGTTNLEAAFTAE